MFIHLPLGTRIIPVYVCVSVFKTLCKAYFGLILILWTSLVYSQGEKAPIVTPTSFIRQLKDKKLLKLNFSAIHPV